MSKYFKSSNTIAIETGKQYIKEYPWQTNGDVDLKEGKWIMVHKEFSQIEIIYNGKEMKKIQVPALKEISLDDFVDCLRGWVQKVQMLSMDNNKIDETKTIAAQTA